MATSPVFTLLQPDCLSDYKRLICASIYLPVIGAVLIHPCRDICNAASHAGSSCGGLLEAFGFVINCSKPFFIDSIDPNMCNTMAYSNGRQLVADQKEPYVGATCQVFACSTFTGCRNLLIGHHLRGLGSESIRSESILSPPPTSLRYADNHGNASDWLARLDSHVLD